MADPFTCEVCGGTFTVPEAALAKYPGWTPRTCMKCRDHTGTRKRGAAPRRTVKPRSRSGGGAGRAGPLLTLDEVLVRYHDGPKTGVFTDGSATPNPGPGGWGAVFVVDDEIVVQRHGHDPDTTNNRMELTALIEAYQMVPEGQEAVIFTDSDLCVKTMTQWAVGWAARGWRRKGGPIKNLELVKTLYALVRARPELTLQWIKAHDGSRWNEYADALASGYMRGVL